MAKQMQAYMNWSGGKDSALCLYRTIQTGRYNITRLLTSVNTVHNRVSMHGVRRSLLEAQAAAIGLPLETIELPEQPAMPEYETAMAARVLQLKNTGCTHAIFGDIFLEDLKLYREEKLQQLGISCVFPLWKIDTTALVKEFIQLGFKSIIVCVNTAYLDKSFCGRVIDDDFLRDLPAGVDPCGENGEFHSFVYEAPLFKHAIPVTRGEVVYKEYASPGDSATPYGFYFCDLY
ncbi:MAG TPA: diphthine--ammonia ligase [Chitinophagaceae bacterium]|nr:diphthine--ammonia ligase [Chitinophagaceae bacterium]